MQHLGVNFGGILRFELSFSNWVFGVFFSLRNLGWFLKVQWHHCGPPEDYAMCSLRIITCNAVIYMS